MKMKKYASFDDYLDDQPAKNRSVIRALRRFVKRRSRDSRSR
jgi:predicted N-acyltransferase